jgi:hypothetical protein
MGPSGVIEASLRQEATEITEATETEDTEETEFTGGTEKRSTS